MSRKNWDFRDVTSGLKTLRDILLGRKHLPHNRFPPLLSPRSLPAPDIPRGPEYRYSDQWYSRRSALGSVKPPVVAPVAEGVPKSKKKGGVCDGLNKKASGDAVKFNVPPTPGLPFWFDGHCYYEYVPDRFRPKPPPCDPCATPPPPCPSSPCAMGQTKPPCQYEPPCLPPDPPVNLEDPCPRSR